MSRQADPIPLDYDDDPGRWQAFDAWQLEGDVHEPVAARLLAEGLAPIIDVGGGQGRLAQLVPGAIVLDLSPTQLARAPHPRVRADAYHLPMRSNTAGAVAMLWMLYHLANPATAIQEAKRILRPGGVFVACTSSRRNDPELTDGYPPTPFDAEDAPAIVASVFGEVEVDSWDAPLTVLPDPDAVNAYCRSHLLPPEAAQRVRPPVVLTKRGCLVWARA